MRPFVSKCFLPSLSNLTFIAEKANVFVISTQKDTLSLYIELACLTHFSIISGIIISRKPFLTTSQGPNLNLSHGI